MFYSYRWRNFLTETRIKDLLVTKSGDGVLVVARASHNTLNQSAITVQQLNALIAKEKGKELTEVDSVKRSYGA